MRIAGLFVAILVGSARNDYNQLHRASAMSETIYHVGYDKRTKMRINSRAMLSKGRCKDITYILFIVVMFWMFPKLWNDFTDIIKTTSSTITYDKIGYRVLLRYALFNQRRYLFYVRHFVTDNFAVKVLAAGYFIIRNLGSQELGSFAPCNLASAIRRVKCANLETLCIK